MSTNINKKRLIRNVVMILTVIALAVGVFFTAKSINSSSQNQMPQMSNMQMSGDSSNASNNSNQAPPEKPDGDSNSNGANSDSSNQNNQPPEMPSNDNSNNSQNTNDNSNNTSTGENNSSSNDSSNQNDNSSNSGTNGQGANPMSNNQNIPQNTPNSFNYKYVVLTVLILLICAVIIYLIMSRFNKFGFRKTLKSADKILIYVMAVIIATSAFTGAGVYALNKSSKPQMSQSSQSVDATGATEVDGESLALGDTYESEKSDESAILVSNGGNATISSATVNKSSGDSSNTENSEFYGVNSGILVQKDSTATIKNTKISTSANGSNAVFSTGENSKIYISDSTITTSGESSSRGLDATYGGYIEADNVNITTQGDSCATLATDRGEGTVKAKNSTLETNGSGSPIIYSTGDISLSNSKGSANGSQMVVIEGKNSASVTDSTLSASANGNRGDTDICGVMIYQSMSGDADEGTGTFTSENSTLSISKDSKYYESAPMFFVTNTDAEINLTNTKLSFGSGTLLNVKGTDEWGTSGSNGGNVTLNATNQTLKGDIEADDISTLSVNLKSSTFEGSINNSNSAKEISLTLDKDSKIKLTADTYVTSLDDSDSSYSNIDFNGYKLYVNSKAVN